MLIYGPNFSQIYAFNKNWFNLYFVPPPPILRLNIAYFAVAEGWLLLDIG